MVFRADSLAEPIPGYRLIERIGRGGFGEVWKAEAPGGLLKAIKFVIGDLESGAEGAAPADQELKALSRVKSVRHPYILSLDRYDVIDGQLVVVMELADRNLWDRFRECRTQGLMGIPRPELLRYMEETAEALDLMNIEHQLQHLDIKPQNLFLVFNHVKVADFGLVKTLEGIGASVSWGVTPAYAAPETFEGFVSRFCDQYSLAIVYQELLTGLRPFNGTNARQLLLQHTQKPPDVTPLEPHERAAVTRALAKKPDERFADCTTFVQALRDAQPTAATVTATPPSAPVTATPRSAAKPMLQTPEASPAETQRTRPYAVLAPVQQGEGILLPAVIIALGGAGLDALKQFRRELQLRFGSLDKVPQLRMLFIDTDPDALVAAADASKSPPLQGRETLLMRLSRPSHYLKSNESRTLLESWLDPNTLYRMPRTPETTGLRALGRLAYANYRREIGERVTTALQACTQADTLEAAARDTGLGLRRNWPRVYLLSGLGGGTGSGMLIDVAYGVRAELVKRGYDPPDIAGVLLAPPVAGASVRGLTLANTVASLIELNHFHTYGFAAKYHAKEEGITCSAGPLSRYVVLPMTQKPEAAGSLAADFLVRELLTPLGRSTDDCRAEQPSSPRFTYETAGFYKMVWPREALLRTAARRQARQLLERWADKNRQPLVEPVKEWLDTQWALRELGPEALIARFQEGCRRTLGRAPEDALVEATGDLPTDTPMVDPAAANAALKRIDAMIGRPGERAPGERGSQLEEALSADAGFVTGEWEKKLSQLMIDLIDLPGFRLAGAEEALHQVGATLGELGQTYEHLCQEKAAEAWECHASIIAQLQVTTTPVRNNKTAPKIPDLLRAYCRARYHELILRRVCMVFQSLRGNVPEFLQEIGFFRARLGDFAGLLRKDARSNPLPGSGKLLLPSGCANLNEAVELLRVGITAEQQAALEDRVQALVKNRFKSVLPIVTDPRHRGVEFVDALREEVERFIDERLRGTDAVSVFLASYPDDNALLTELRRMYEAAAPELTTAEADDTNSFTFAMLPTGGDTERFQRLAEEAWPDVDWALTDRADEIVLYRVQSRLSPGSLPHAGPLGQEAYRQMSTAQHLMAHSRADVADWLPLQPQGESTSRLTV